MMKNRYSALVILIYFVLFGCSEHNQQTESAVDLYEKFLHFKPPASVSDLTATASDGIFDFMASAYFQYKAQNSYFNDLLALKHFPVASDMNRSIVKVACKGDDFIQDFSYWTDKHIKLDNSNCYTGVLMPTIHYIVYQTKTKQVDHFVTGVR